jgi:2,3-bisphosphoglycerate-independent phosphoglycerate mutase
MFFMSQKKIHTTLLIILDGWGIPQATNTTTPIRPETAPHYFSWFKKFPHTELEASGEAVGLFKGQEGNSEAGHLNLGAGRIVKQDGVYISDAIEDGSFFKNNAFKEAIHHAQKYGTAIHVLGLLSNHNSAHSCPEHLYALLDLFYKEGMKKVYLHLFTDGRDSGPYEALKHLEKLREHLHGTEKIVSVMGRFYAMDRNKNWERIQKAYKTIVTGEALYTALTPEQAIEQAYQRDETDEFISPTLIKHPSEEVVRVEDNDVLFFFNLRSDRARELTKALVQKDFEQINQEVFTRERIPQNTRFVAMTDFGPELESVLTAFPSRDVKNSLVQVLCPRKQLYIAESEKFAHITYFFNGGYPRHICDEQFVKIESDPLINYREKPAMQARTLANYLIKTIEEHRYEFIAVNFANADMVGHTGDLQAAEKAVATLDHELERVIKVLLKEGGQGIITADHGNVEEMINKRTGQPDTEHSVNRVPLFLIISHHHYKQFGIPHSRKLSKGKLCNVAPTILKFMGIKKPAEMAAKPLF